MNRFDIVSLFSPSLLLVGGFCLAACTKTDAIIEEPIQNLSNSPYFLLANGCELPLLSAPMESLQLAVKERLAKGFKASELDQTVIENGAVMSFQCGSQGSIRVETLKLYLVDHNLKPVEDETCPGGSLYSGWVSSLDPSIKYGDFPKIECAALKQVMTGEYAVRVCTNGSDVKSLDIVAREPVTPPTGLTAFEPEDTCPTE